MRKFFFGGSLCQSAESAGAFELCGPKLIGKLCPRDREPPLAWWWSARSLMRVPGSDTGPASIRIRDWEGLSNLGFDHVPGLGRL